MTEIDCDYFPLLKHPHIDLLRAWDTEICTNQQSSQKP